ncbi:unnamed protein product, partial [Staurois parvus]
MSLVFSCTVRSLWSSVLCPQSQSLLYCVSLWSSCTVSAVSVFTVISCTVSTVSGHSLYCVRSLWSSVLCSQSLVIPCTVSASLVILYCVRSLWSHLCTVCPQSLVHLLYCVHS